MSKHYHKCICGIFGLFKNRWNVFLHCDNKSQTLDVFQHVIWFWGFLPESWDSLCSRWLCALDEKPPTVFLRAPLSISWTQGALMSHLRDFLQWKRLLWEGMLASGMAFITQQGTYHLKWNFTELPGAYRNLRYFSFIEFYNKVSITVTIGIGFISELQSNSVCDMDMNDTSVYLCYNERCDLYFLSIQVADNKTEHYHKRHWTPNSYVGMFILTLQ